ncbi:MAG: S46 family peptidase [Bacteroidota bacterium]
MKKITLLLTIAVMFVLLFSAMIPPDEGEWLLTQFGKLPFDQMKKNGLTLTPDQIYNPNGTSLVNAVILLGGGTASFVSKDGLIMTNHHVAFGALQALSTVQDDYLLNGFLAATKDKELSAPSYSARIVIGIKDVTSDVLSAVKDTMTPENRAKAIREKSRAIEKTEKGETENECSVSETFSGLKYILYTFEVIRDIRVVYAPPGSIGVFGGETDNWMWPRHTGDFALLRAYVAPDGKHTKYSKDNVPYHPKVFLPISNKPYKEGSFAMIMGFPGRTFRYRTSSEIKISKEETLPMYVEQFKKRIDIIDSWGKKDRSLAIKYASKVKGLANTYKNYEGALEGMRRSNLLKIREDDETAFSKFIDTKSDLETKYESLLSDITASQRDLKTFNKKSIALSSLYSASDIARLANRFKEYANSFKKDSTGEMKGSGQNELNTYIPDLFKDTDVRVDKELLAATIRIAAELPKDQQIEAVKNIVGDKTGVELDKKIQEYIEDLYKDSHLTTPEDAQKLLSKSADDIKDDAFVKFVVALDKDNTPLIEHVSKYNAEIGKLRAQWIQARMAWKGEDMYPDANRSIRFTYGTVKGYAPRDAVHYDYITSLTGVMEKESDNEDFIVPAKLKTLWEKKDYGNYTDPTINDVPVAFLSDLDITGGNSGSPVINGNGEFMGIAFDGDWEAIVGDYYFQESLNRTISVDSRYILFTLDKFSNAKNIMDELVIK